MSGTTLALDAAVTGAGISEVGRKLERSALSLSMEACLAALADAGLDRADIDGVSTYPGSSPSTFEVVDGLGLAVDWHDGGDGGPVTLRALFNAFMAVSTGWAKHVLVYRTVVRNAPAGPAGGSSGTVGGLDQWSLPFGAHNYANRLALYAQRFCHERGLERRHLGAVALNGRRNAARNPWAVYREPLTLDDYLASPMISDPLCLLDCDVPVSGSIAFVVSRGGVASSTGKPPLAVESLSSRLAGRASFDQWDESAMWSAGPDLWSRTSLGPGDVDVAQLYDGYSVMVLEWLEALGFCERGAVGPLVDSGAIALDGRIPVNTGGGMLSAGRLHGFLPVYEACLQLWGEAGERQVPGAEVAVATNGAGPYAGCLLLRRAE